MNYVSSLMRTVRINIKIIIFKSESHHNNFYIKQFNTIYKKKVKCVKNYPSHIKTNSSAFQKKNF